MFSITDYSKASLEALRQEIMEFYDIVFRESVKKEDEHRSNMAKLMLNIFHVKPIDMKEIHIGSMRTLMACTLPLTIRDFATAINAGTLDESGVLRLLGALKDASEPVALRS